MLSRSEHSFLTRLQTAVVALFCSVLFTFDGAAQIGLPPTITVQPSDQAVPVGGSALFEVKAASLTSISYKWFRNGVRINGATSGTLTIPNAQTGDVGTYYVEVKNLTGTALSSNAALTIFAVSNAPLVLHPPRLTAEGAILDVSGPALYSYVVQETSDGVNWQHVGSRFAGSGRISVEDGDLANHRLYRAAIAPSVVHEQCAASGNAVEIRNDKRGAQSFRHSGGSDYSVTKLVVHLSTESTPPDGTLNVSLGTGLNSGALPGSLVAIVPSAITNASGGASFQVYEIVYPTPVGPLNSGTTYYLNFDTGAPNGRRFWLQCSSSSAYNRGTYYRDGGNDNKDIRFEIWGQ